jgi:hypothetical protein
MGDGLVVYECRGRAAGLEPGGGFRGERHSRWAAGRGEEGEEGLDGSLELEEERGLGSVSVGCGGVAGQADGELGGFVDGSDDGAVGEDGGGEDLTLFEEAHVFYVSVEVVGKHVQHAGDERGAEEAGFFGEGVFHGDGSCRVGGRQSRSARYPTLRKKREGWATRVLGWGTRVFGWGSCVFGCVVEVGVLLRGEGAGDGFAEAER